MFSHLGQPLPTRIRTEHPREEEFVRCPIAGFLIPLYLVAPDDRRNKVFEEVNRPTFSRLVDVGRYIAFETLKEQLEAVDQFIKYLKQEFLEEL